MTSEPTEREIKWASTIGLIIAWIWIIFICGLMLAGWTLTLFGQWQKGSFLFLTGSALAWWTHWVCKPKEGG